MGLYDKIEADLTLRDLLALDRTVLASRRTWLATARTSLALFVSGASFIHLFDQLWMQWSGGALLVLAFPVLAWGAWRYRRELRDLDRLIIATKESR